MATEYTITYTFTGQDNTSGNRSVAFNRFSASGDTGRNIGRITSIQYVHYHTSAGSMKWGLMGRLVLNDGTTFVSDQIYHNIDGDVVGYTNTFSALPTAEQFAMLASVQTLDTQWKTTSGGYSSKLYWRATSKYPMRIIVKFIEEPPITYAPKVDKFEAVRCNEIGVRDDEGQYITTSLKLSVGDASGLPIAQCRIYYAANDYPNVNSSPYVDVTSRISDLISGVTFDTSILTGVWNLGSIWNFAVVFVIDKESAISTVSVARGSTSFHISDEPGGGAAVGGYSTGTSANPKFESHVPAHMYGGIEGVTNYSASEVNTGGHWIDGKPIYRYVLVATITAKDDIKLGTLPSEYETMINMRGVMINPSNKSARPIPHTYYGNLTWNAGFYILDKTITLQLGSGYSGTLKTIVVLEYTKP